MNKSNIAIIGMMGIEKKEIGKALSNELSMQFCDTDELLEYEYGTVSRISDILGVEGFYKYQNIVVNQVSTYENTVITTGESVLVIEESSVALKNAGIVVLLESDLKSMFANIVHKEKYFLPKGDFKEFSDRFKSFKEGYNKLADVVINIHLKSMEEIIEEIIDKIAEYHET